MRLKARPLLRIRYGCESRKRSGLTQTPYNYCETIQPRFFLNEIKNNTTPIAARMMATVKPADDISPRE